MSRSIFGWDYPPGAENDPNAPYNQVDEDDIETCEICGELITGDGKESDGVSTDPKHIHFYHKGCLLMEKAENDRDAREDR